MTRSEEDFVFFFFFPPAPLRGLKLQSLMEILGCRSEENSFNILPSAATMLFHGLSGGEVHGVHGVVEEMERRGKSESTVISSAIDMGETEAVGVMLLPSSSGLKKRL